MDDIPLLFIKMFLAEIRPWARIYQYDNYVCKDFAYYVLLEAKRRDIRCGYVVLYFKDSDTAHAAVVFNTDHGLKYFEPQDGNEIDPIIGKEYLVNGYIKRLEEIEIKWND